MTKKKKGNQRKYHYVQGFLCQQEIKRGRGKEFLNESGINSKKNHIKNKKIYM
jgi:hypothetical protein